MDMDFERICINCMGEKEPGQIVCPHCHFDPGTYTLSQNVLPPFTILNGRYLLGRELGRGGFGITYIAKDLVLERVVAVKEFFLQEFMYRDNTTSSVVSVSVSAAESQEQYYWINREKFEKEAKIIAHLDNLHGIVKVYDYFSENDTVYMVLEYLDGVDLKKYVTEHGGKLPAEEVVQRLSSIMASLQQLHEHDILHRDISADNIMVLADGSLKLLDFGGAKVQTSEERSSMVLAKRGYTPIEQYQMSGNQGPWTDVYSMAATIYYCICGQAPVESTMRMEEDILKTPTELGIPISKNLEKVLMKGLALKSQNRYRSMADFMNALQECVGGGKKKKHGKGVLIALVALVLLSGGAGAAAYVGMQNSKPILNRESIPEKLDINTVFAESKPLVIEGENLDKVENLYLNDEKIEDLTILQQTDKQIQVTFSVPKEAGTYALRADSQFMGILPVSSEKLNVELYDSGMKDMVITAMLKNGKPINRDYVRINEPFSLGFTGEDMQGNVNVFVNGVYVESSFNDGIVSADISQELVDKINEEGIMSARMELYTPEKYETSRQSNEISVNVYSRLIDNAWLGLIGESNFQIVDFDAGLENTAEAVTERIDALYNQGVRFLRYTQDNGVDLSFVMDNMKQKEDLYLVVNLSSGRDMQSVYDTLVSVSGNTSAFDRVIAMVDSAMAFEQWMSVDIAQDAVQILFMADQDGMTFEQSLEYWTANNIKAVSYNTESYWNNVYLRNKSSVTEAGISFFCENPTDILELYSLLNPEEYFENGTPFTGVKGIITSTLTPERYQLSDDAMLSIEQARYFRDRSDGEAIKPYLEMLSLSGYTIMVAVKDDGKEIEGIAAELDNLGFHSSVLGAEDAFRNAYIGVVRTSNTSDVPPTLLIEDTKSSSDGVVLEADYVSEISGRQFHIRSNGRKNDIDNSTPVAIISTDGINLAMNQPGLNFVVYDDYNDCIIDSFCYDVWGNQGNPDPVLTKQGSGWNMMRYSVRKQSRKEAIINYFNYLDSIKQNSLIVAAIADEGTYNLDPDIQAAMAQIGITASFNTNSGFQKSYIGLFGADVGDVPIINGQNDTFSNEQLQLTDYVYDGKTFNVISEGHGVGDSSAHISIDGREMTNGIRGLHIVVYDKETQRPTNYTWIDCYDDLKINWIVLS